MKFPKSVKSFWREKVQYFTCNIRNEFFGTKKRKLCHRLFLYTWSRVPLAEHSLCSVEIHLQHASLRWNFYIISRRVACIKISPNNITSSKWITHCQCQRYSGWTTLLYSTLCNAKWTLLMRQSSFQFTPIPLPQLFPMLGWETSATGNGSRFVCNKHWVQKRATRFVKAFRPRAKCYRIS